MKRTLPAAAGLFFLAATAAAQPSLTMFGIVDLGLREVRSDGASRDRLMISGGSSSGRLGFRGVEDLGDGLSAGFWIETTVAADAGGGGGAAGQFWDRRATLSLTSRQLGEARLGRDYVPTFQTWVEQDPFGNNGVAGGGQFSGAGARSVLDAFGASSAPRTDVRANNTLQYLLPDSLGGVYGGLMAAPTETATASGGGRLEGGRLGWRSGKINASAALLQTRTDRAGAPWIRDIAAGASYGLGPATLSAAYRRFTYLASSQTNMMVAGTYRIRQGLIKANYVRGDAQGRLASGADISADDGNKIGLGYVYSLSKRSSLYAHAARVSNKGAAKAVIPGGSSGILPGGTSSGYEFGLRHSF